MTTQDQVFHQRRASAPRPDPVRRRGEPFFDQLVDGLHSPAQVRRSLHQLVKKQYEEADRVSELRGWGGAQPHGNDRYQYSLEQEKALKSMLPGAELLRPRGSLLYRIGNAVIYPMHYGSGTDDCPTSARLTEPSEIQKELAGGRYFMHPTLFDVDAPPPTVVWLLFTGNSVEGGPLASYVALPGGVHPDWRIELPRIEPLLSRPSDAEPDGLMPGRPQPTLTVPPEPTPQLRLRP